MAEKLFISYAGPDREWARWVAYRLRDAGYEVEMDTSWSAGDNFVLRMSDALEAPGRVVCLFSHAYFEPGRFSEDEWTAVMADRDRRGRLIPLRLEDVKSPAILRPLIYVDLFDLDEHKAEEKLLRAVGGSRPPTRPPPFPGTR